MRRAFLFLFAGLPLPLALVTGCPAEAPLPRAPVVPQQPIVAAPAPAAPRSYTLADPDALPRGSAIALEVGALGVLLDGARVVVRGDDLRIARDVTSARLLAVDRVPAWLGGGFLFRTGTALYASDAFDGALRPVAAIQEGAARLAFGPKSVLVRGNSGSRQLIDLASGKTEPMLPLGLVDLLALADGGRLLISSDRGAQWNDATASLGGAPTSLVSRPGEIWIETDNNRALRVDPGGVLRELDNVPAAIPERLRPRDPGWHATETPLLAAVRRGARLDDGTVIVAAGGDVARVDLQTGTATILVAGRLPPDLTCEALRVGDDVLAVCSAPRRPSIVASHLAEGRPTMERTFPVEGPFYAGDEGTLIFGGSCDGARMRLSACVRDARGVWHEHGVDPGLTADAGADAGAKPSVDAGGGGGAPDVNAIVRWVVSDGGRPIALVGGKNPAGFARRSWQRRHGPRARRRRRLVSPRFQLRRALRSRGRGPHSRLRPRRSRGRDARSRRANSAALRARGPGDRCDRNDCPARRGGPGRRRVQHPLGRRAALRNDHRGREPALQGLGGSCRSYTNHAGERGRARRRGDRRLDHLTRGRPRGLQARCGRPLVDPPRGCAERLDAQPHERRRAGDRRAGRPRDPAHALRRGAAERCQPRAAPPARRRPGRRARRVVDVDLVRRSRLPRRSLGLPRRRAARRVVASTSAAAPSPATASARARACSRACAVARRASASRPSRSPTARARCAKAASWRQRSWRDSPAKQSLQAASG